MANEQYLKYGDQLLFADHAADFGAAPTTAANSLIIGTPTDVQLDLGGVAASGGARQSAKFDLGDTDRGTIILVKACIETVSNPADLAVFDFYVSPSSSTTAGTGNAGNATGVDGGYTISNGKLAQMQPIGSLSCWANTINIGFVGIFEPMDRYGSLIVVNRTAVNCAAGGNMDETHIVMTKIIRYPGT